METDSSQLHPLKEKLDRSPEGPGVYLMRDVAGQVIYVGKARNLKKRLAAYFQHVEGGTSSRMDAKTVVMVRKIADFETILTATEKEALILEANLIKRYRPRYNVVYKDDKRYPVLRLDTRHPFPSLTIARKIEKDGALYFGPYSSAHAVRQTLKIVNRTFRLRKCKDRDFKTRTRPCLHCQMDGCQAPCCRDVDQTDYDEMVREVVLFLKGRAPDLVRKIKREMMAAAREQAYEKAARLRDKLFALEKTIEKQMAVTADFKDRDVVGLARSADMVLITFLNIRGGYLLGTRHYDFTEVMGTDEEVLTAFVRQYYENTHFIPEELILPLVPEDQVLIEEWLHQIKGRKVRLLMPQRGEKLRLLKMAMENAINHLEELITSRTSNRDLMERLAQRLHMERLPERIECFDNSTLSGSSSVAGMVVFESGKPAKHAYRKYKINSVAIPDDYAAMAEILGRRYGKGEASHPLPDLLIVDGGKGQLNIALTVLKELKLSGLLYVIGIAKKDEKKGETTDKIYLPGRMNPLNLSRDPDLLLFLQRVRDETHRFAITFHRKQRSRASVHSVLDTIPGIGPKRKRLLLKHFGNLKNIRTATVDELSSLPGMNRSVAEAVLKRL